MRQKRDYNTDFIKHKRIGKPINAVLTEAKELSQLKRNYREAISSLRARKYRHFTLSLAQAEKISPLTCNDKVRGSGEDV